MKKSKFWTFALSAIPGMGHVYLGLPVRGICIMASFFAWGLLALFGAYNTGGIATLLIFGPLPIIWILSLVDALTQCDRMNLGVSVSDPSPVVAPRDGLDFRRPEGIWTLLFSLIPGAGHMCLGWMRKGLELMTVFFGALYLACSLRLDVFLFTLPVIWFYSFFDALQLASNKPAVPEDARLFGWKPQWVGIGLFGIGVVILFDRIVSPLFHIDYRTLEMIRTGITALLFIGGGLKLMSGQRVRTSTPHSSWGDAADGGKAPLATGTGAPSNGTEKDTETDTETDTEEGDRL